MRGWLAARRKGRVTGRGGQTRSAVSGEEGTFARLRRMGKIGNDE